MGGPLDSSALEAAAKHSYEWEGDRKGIMYVGWVAEPESVREQWRESVRQPLRVYLAAATGSPSLPFDTKTALENGDAR